MNDVVLARTISTLAGSYCTYTFNPTKGVWGYTLNQSLADSLTAGQVVYDHLIVMSAGGPATYRIAGTNDVAVITGSSTAELTATNRRRSASDVDPIPPFLNI